MAGNTFTWTVGSGSGSIASNWLWIGGTAGSIIGGPPNAGDTAIVTSGTVLMPLDATLNANTVEIAGTAGTAAVVVFQGDNSITAGNPSLDFATLVETQVPGQSAAGTTVLDTLGIFVNQGTIEANGPSGSSFTIDIAQGTSGLPGVFINQGGMTVAIGNAMTIATGANAAFYNASDIHVIGGSLLLTTLAAGAFDGGYAPVRGVVVMSRGATVEDNIAYPTTVAGPAPVFAFVDGAGNTLKLDQQANFGGRILGFATGDTIDLGTGLTITGTSYNAITGVLSLLDNSATVASLAFTSGNGNFQTFGGGNSDLLLTTTTTNDVWNAAGGGSFATGTNWSGGTPTSSSSVLIGAANPNLTGTIIAAGSNAVGSLLLVGRGETLAVTGSLGVTTGPLEQGGGTIEVGGGATLGVTALSQIGGGGLMLDPGAQMNVAGRASLGFANAGTLLPSTNGHYGVLLQGSGFINGGTLRSGGYVDIGVEGGGFPAQVSVTASGTLGGAVTDTHALLNSGPTSFGSLTLSGIGTQWTDAGSATDPNNTSGYMIVGYNALNTALPYAGAAGLTVTSSATLTEQGFAKIGASADSLGFATVSAGGVWNIGLVNGGFLLVGGSGTGSLDVAGGTVAVGGFGTYVANGVTTNGGGIGIGRSQGGNGVVTVDGGLLTSAGGIAVGFAGTGNLSVVNSGTVEVSGTGATSKGLGIGKVGTGAMTIATGGVVSVTGTGGVGIGQTSGAGGTLVVGGSGGSALLSLGSTTSGLGIGYGGGYGLTEVLAGGTIAVASANSGIGIGQTTGSSGTLLVSGTGAVVSLGTATTGFGIGYNGGSGALEILNGGAVSLAAGGIGVGTTSGVGSILVSGGGALLALGAGASLGISVASGLVEVLAGGTIANSGTGSGIGLGSAGTLAGDGLVNSSVIDNGTIVALAGSIGSVSTLEITGGVTGTGVIGLGSYSMLRLDSGLAANGGTVSIGTGATLEVNGTASGADVIVFAGTGAAGEMVLEQPGTSFTNSIVNLSGGDIIALGNFSTITGATVSSPGVITVTGLAGTTAAIYHLNNVTFAGTQTSLFATTIVDPINGGTLQAFEVACFAAGTRLAGLHGQMPVEALRAGDLVRTAGGALRPVRWIGQRTIDLTRHPDPRRAQPIRIRADAFADGVPSRDLLLSPDHAVFDRGRLIPIRLLANDATILRETRRRKITYFHVELDSHDLLLAEGLPAESYLDCGNRGIFENAADPLILHPDFLDPAAQARWRERASCAPIEAGEAAVERVWRRLADRALALGVAVPEPEFVADPALAVLAGGKRLRPVSRAARTYRFALPAGVPLQLVSRAAHPSDAHPWVEDQRLLGVMVRALTLETAHGPRALALDDPALARGWWRMETDGVSSWRWTDGTAVLPALDLPATLAVALAGTLPYPRAGRSRAA